METKTIYIGCDRRICHIGNFISGLNPFMFQDNFDIKFITVNKDDIEDEVYDDMFNRYVDLPRYVERGKLQIRKMVPASTNITSILTEQKRTVKILETFLIHTIQYITTFNTSYVSNYIDMYILQEIQEYKQTKKVGIFLEKLVEEESKIGYDLDDIVEKYLMKSEDRKRTLAELYSQEVFVKNLLKEKKIDEARNYVSKLTKKTI
jgi:uncharacterized membrane-anchored protein YjiN (DUF445 family)